MPNSHPSSDDPGFEWRVSFSLVEKNIFGEIYYLFRKVCLICKKITVIGNWKKQYNFHSYMLKTVFLRTLEEKWSEPERFTGDNILSMIVEVFSYLKEYFKNDNIPNYFIPEMNILEQYSKTMKKDSRIQLIGELERLTNKTFLINCICETFKNPFSPIDKKFCNDHLYYWYKEIILSDRGIQKEEGKTELLTELYLTFLCMLYQRVFGRFFFVKKGSAIFPACFIFYSCVWRKTSSF